ncbi:DNA replication factor C, large subunit [Violaceomyces palustris]|uniref:DNA replication factor C, large subunit n=1 Tax=Violaceomyces palustris TaxID=1673888 RepID=A0ACD0NN34_9BASI|nr:DNA replication factor C, large subunit [Violaceomyces palustris]
MAPPKKSSSAPNLPKGQSSLSTFFGAKPSSAPSTKQPRSSPPPPPPKSQPKGTIRQPPSPKKEAYSQSSATSSRYFKSKSDLTGSKASEPVVIDDSDDGDEEERQPPKSKSKTRPKTQVVENPIPKRKKAIESDSELSDEDVSERTKRKKKNNGGTQSNPPPVQQKRKTEQTASSSSSSSSSSSGQRSRSSKKVINYVEDEDDEDGNEDEPAPKIKATQVKKAAPPIKASSAPKKKEEPAEVKAQVTEKAEDTKPKKPTFRELQARKSAGPINPGSKEVPVGAPNCLAGLTIVFTGELESLGREESVELAKRYGAKVTGAPSSKTSYVVVGENAGPKKLDQIKKNKIATLTEDEFLDLIRTRGAGQIDEKTKKKLAEEEKKIKEVAKEMGAPAASSGPVDTTGMLWTVKYAPRNVKDLVGNKTNIEKLQQWLRAWPKSLECNFKKPGPHATNTFRAVLISGGPGIGKTTAAHLIAKTEGYTPIELNASDARSKKLVESYLKDTINNTSLDGWYSGGKVDRSVVASGVQISDRTVLIMDEVDGMSGGDRGGVGAINALIKKTKIPIICICNDRKNPKMRPFESTCANLTWRKPETPAIKSRLMSIAFREKLKIPGEVMQQLIESAQNDIRSVINMLSTWKLSNDSMSFDEGKELGNSNAKPGMHTPFTLYSELSSPYMFSHTSKKTLNDKTDLYFQDHAIVPLMVAENYLKSRPVLAQKEGNEQLRSLKHLELASKAAESISDGDMIDKMIHGPQQHWSLMPLHGIASTVRPCSYTYGPNMNGFPSFPSWLGQNSKQTRLSRAVVDIQTRMRLSCSGSRHDVRQHYLPAMFPLMVEPLIKDGSDGIEDVISFMDDYYLTIEDRDAILELGLEPNNGEAMVKKVATAVKTSFTRKYNSTSHPIAFNKGIETGGAKAKQLKADTDVPDLEDVPEEDDQDVPDDVSVESEDDLSKDKLVKRPKTSLSKGKRKKV